MRESNPRPLLVTLDPASWDAPLENEFMHQWINVHATPAVLNFRLDNLIAMAGGQWGEVKKARNFRFDGNHADVMGMYGKIYKLVDDYLICE